MKAVPIIYAVLFCISAILGGADLSSGKDFGKKVQSPVSRSIDIRKDTQEKEDAWTEQKLKLESEFEALEEERKNLEARLNDLRKIVEMHRQTVKSIETKLLEIDRISNELDPFLENLYQRLSELIQNNTPFLITERTKRLDTLRETLNDTTADTAEKFRKVMEALFIEAEYGNTVEVYQQKIDFEAKTILVNVLRLGRLSLFCQTLDGKLSGFYDPGAEQWKGLSEKYNRSIRAAMEMGSKRQPVELLKLPIGKVAANE
jgi:hypothetical protein